MTGLTGGATAVHLTRTTPAYATAVGAAGRAGAVRVLPPIVTFADGAEGGELPTAFVATTEKLRLVLFGSPRTTQTVAPFVVQVCPLLAVTT